MKPRLLYFTVLILLIAVFFTACAANEPQARLRYLQNSFDATLTGNRGGTDFSCEAVYQDGALLSLRYTAPRALDGITLERGEEGWSVRLDEMCYSLPEHQLQGLLSPAYALAPPEPTVHSVQKLAHGEHLSVESPAFPSPITITLSSDGLPTVVSVEDMSFGVTLRPR